MIGPMRANAFDLYNSLVRSHLYSVSRFDSLRNADDTEATECGGWSRGVSKEAQPEHVDLGMNSGRR